MMQVGEIRQAMWEDMVAFLEGVVNRNSWRDHYWLFVAGKWEGNCLRKKVIVSDRPIPPMLDSFELFIDNRRGQYELVHCLPADVPLPAELLQGPVIADVVKSAQKVSHAITYLNN